MPDTSSNLKRQALKAAKSGDTATLRELLERDPSLLQVRDADESTLLHCAAWKGQAETAILLLELGADVNAKSQNNHYGDTPLHAAAHGNQRAVAEILLAHGADIHAVNPAGRTPLAETELHNAKAVANLLKRHLA